MSDSLTRKRAQPWTKGQAFSFPEGTNLFDTQESTRRIFLLNTGEVRLAGPKGVIFDHLQRGSFLGESSLLNLASNTRTATALSAVEGTAFRKSDLLAEWKRDPNSAMILVKDLARRLQRYEELICDLITEQAEVRLARLLLRSAPARPATGWVRLPFCFTNAELARMVGTTRWRISHLLNRFSRLGWLRRDRQLWLLRERALEYLSMQ